MDRSIPARWIKSTYSNDAGVCVEVAAVAESRLVRDSKLGDGSPLLTVPQVEFQALLSAVRGGQFDR